MRTLLLFALALVLACGCSKASTQRHQATKQWLESEGKIKVLSTTAMIDDLVKQIGGDHVTTLVLIQGDLDPHSYQLVKGDSEKLNAAQVLFYSGLGLEHGASLHHYLAENKAAIGLGDKIVAQNPSLAIYVDGNVDPHIWTDAAAWAKIAPFIAAALSEKDPAHAQEFHANAKRVEAELNKLHHELWETLHEIPAEKRYLVTSHDAFNYFSRAYLTEPEELEDDRWRIRFAAPEGLSPDSQLSHSHIAEIVAYLKKFNIPIIFPESNVSRDSIKKITQAAREEGLDVYIACCPLYGDAMGPPGSDGDTYIKMQRYNAKTLALHMDHAPNPHGKHEHRK